MKNSYFEFPSPLVMLDRWLNPETCHHKLLLRGVPLTVSWTRRAERELARRSHPLLAEMQLYFTCVVKKRVVFHDAGQCEGIEGMAVTDRLHIAFRPVEANSCDPVEFAANFPVRREFESPAAVRMHPSGLHLDYRHGAWVGEFSI
jgi:hypothetical protein